MTTKIEAGRSTVEMISALAVKLTNSHDLLSQRDRLALGEILRDAADALDNGRPMPAPVMTLEQLLMRYLKKKIIPTDKRDHFGRQLFRIV